MNIKWHIRVSFERDGYEEYPCFSLYDIDAPTYSDAERKARQKFCVDFGFKMEHTKAYTFDREQTQYRAKIDQSIKRLQRETGAGKTLCEKAVQHSHIFEQQMDYISQHGPKF